jgi:hypothetical protein
MAWKVEMGSSFLNLIIIYFKMWIVKEKTKNEAYENNHGELKLTWYIYF